MNEFDNKKSIIRAKARITSYIPYLINKYTGTNFYKTIDQLDENNFFKIISDTFSNTNQLAAFYSWIGLPAAWMNEAPYDDVATMTLFWFEYSKEKKVRQVVRKLVDDLASIQTCYDTRERGRGKVEAARQEFSI